MVSYPFENTQEQPQQQPMGIRSDISVSNMNKDFNKWHLSTDDMLDDIEHQLKGEIKKKGEWISCGKRLMNDDGIREMITIVYGHANKFVFLAKFKEDDILDIMRHLDDTLIDLLSQKWHEFKIDLPDLDVIRSIILTVCYAGATRGLDGWTMERTGASFTTREVITPEQIGQKKSSLFGFLGK